VGSYFAREEDSAGSVSVSLTRIPLHGFHYPIPAHSCVSTYTVKTELPSFYPIT
jgi:hypothetical protein